MGIALGACLACEIGPIAGADQPATGSRVTTEPDEMAKEDHPDEPRGFPGLRPEASQRLVRVFDFEEREINPLPIPLHWNRAQDDPQVPRERPGFPLWNEASLDYTVAARGEGSVRLPTHGGSTSLRLRPGVVPVFPSADYLISAMVRTEGLDHARAVLVARLLDDRGEPIEDSEVRSELIQTHSAWVPVVVEVWGDFPSASHLQVDLELLQPRHYREPILDKHHIWPQDVSGAAWFDDVAIVQLPRVQLTANSPTNIVVDPETPSLTARVRDLTGESLRASIRIHDLDGRLVGEETWSIRGGRSHHEFSPALEGFGWYRAVMEIRNDRGVVGRAASDFLWMPQPAETARRSREGRSGADRLAGTGSLQRTAGAPAPDRARFGLTLLDGDPEVLDHLPDLLHASGAGDVTIPIWDRDLDPERLEEDLERVAGVLDRVLDDWRYVTLALGRVPDVVGVLINADAEDVPSAVASEPRLWGAYLEPWLDRYGQVVRRWQVGQPGDVHYTLRPDPGQDAAGFAELVGRLVPGPTPVIPWGLEVDPARVVEGSGSRGAELLLDVSGEVSDSHFADQASAWASREGVDSVTYALRPTEWGALSPRQSVADLSRKAVLFWASLSDGAVTAEELTERVTLVEPWAWHGDRRRQIAPRPHMAAWRTLAAQLADRRVVGELQVEPGVRCLILAPHEGAAPGRGGALVVWRESAAPESSVLTGVLSTGRVRVMDVFGNERSVQPSPPGEGLRPAHRIRATDLPVFVEGIDLELVRFLAGVRIEPGLVPSRHQEHDAVLVLSNPWPAPISGRFYIAAPGEAGEGRSAGDRRWRVSPRNGRFSIPSGERARVPLGIAFSTAEEAGVKEFLVDVELRGARDYGVVQARARVELGLEHLELQLDRRYSRGGDLIIEATVGNTGDEQVSLDLVAFAPGLPRDRRSIVDLPPGTSTVRRFAFPGMAEALRGERVFVSLSDPADRARLNRSIRVE